MRCTIDLHAANDLNREERAKAIRAQRGLCGKVALAFLIGLAIGFPAGLWF